MSESDLTLVLAWRNHESVRKFMFSQEVITFEKHKEWFEGANMSPLHKLFIYEDSGMSAGFVQMKETDAQSHVYEWGFYISPDAAKGTGTKMLQAGIKQAFYCENALKLYGEVLDFNHASIKLHDKLGFTKEGILRKHAFVKHAYHDVHCFGLLRDEVE